MKTISRLSVAAASVAVFSVGFDAEACSCGGGPYLGESLPADGAKGVPTNVVPWLDMAGNVHLLDDKQVEVPTKLKAVFNPVAGCSQLAEVVPEVELEPNTTYTIIVESDEDGDGNIESFSFTTGDGPLEATDLPVPPLEAGFFNAQNYTNSCVYSQIQSCVAGDYEGLLELKTLEDGKETRHYVDLFQGGIIAHGGLETGTKEFCVEVRARDLAGRRSKAASFCTSTEALYVLPLDEDVWQPTCSSEVVERLNAENADEDPSEIVAGCSVVQGPMQRGVWSGLLIPLLGGLLIGRRRRQPF